MTYTQAVERLRAEDAQGWGNLAAFHTHAIAAAAKVDTEVRAGQSVLPPPDCVFGALEATPLHAVRAVILGQDPYPTRGNAHGFAFSVQPGRPIPGSLKTMFRSLHADFGLAPPPSGDLRPWAVRGVLLLNTIFTVREGQAHSHKAIGWRQVSEDVIRAISRERENIVFLLWGGPALAFAPLIDTSRHGIVTSAHPSPLNVQKGGGHPFIDAQPFLRANDYLVSKGLPPIDWSL